MSIYRKEPVCQNCYNLNSQSENGCMAYQEKGIEGIPESETECSKKEIQVYDTQSATCPYCGEKNWIDEIYDSDFENHEEIECGSCERLFKFMVTQCVSYDIFSYVMKEEEE